MNEDLIRRLRDEAELHHVQSHVSNLCRKAADALEAQEQDDVKWSRQDVQRVLYNLVRKYQQANVPEHYHDTGRGYKRKVGPKRFILFGPRLPFLGGDSELLRNAVYNVAIPTLKDNNWWPEDDTDS